MNDINTVTISGNITRDPESFSEGNVARFSIGSNRSFRRQGETEWTEEATFVDCSAFSGTARMVLAKLAKGDKVTVTGRLELNRWDAEDGTKRSQLRVIVQGIVSEGLFRKTDDAPASPSEQSSMDAELTEAAAETAAEPVAA